MDNSHKNGRTLSLLLYLNEGWEEADGGELRIFDGSAVDSGVVKKDIFPIFNRAVLFWSDDTVPHEVPGRRKAYCTL